MGIKTTVSAWKKRYVRFVEKQGFGIIAVICVAVITATAVWTDHDNSSYASPTPPVSQDISAAQLMQESLRAAVTVAPNPTTEPRVWHAPLKDTNILRPYDNERMVQSGVTGIWAIHDAVDLAADRGSMVYAMGDGIVLDAGEDRLNGVWLVIDHGDSIEALYAGLALGNGYLPGDSVRGGDIIGFTGAGLLEENDLPPHLHLRITNQGQSIDPLTLWK